MDAAYLVQQSINGIVLGSQYALFAAGLTMIFGVLRILNVAHGAIFMWGGMMGFILLSKANVPLIIGILVGGVISGLISVLLDRLVFRVLRKKTTRTFVDNLAPFVASIGFMILLVNLAQHIFGSTVWKFPSEHIPQGIVKLGGLFITKSQLFIIIPACVIIICLHFFITRSKTGKAIRAIAYDKTISRLLGISVEPMIMMVFFLAGLVAGIAGCLTGIAFSVGPFMAHDVLLKGFAAIILGGMGSLGGSLLGGFIIGISEVFSITFISSDFKDAVAFLVLFIFLVIRPQGLFGKKEEIRA